MERDYSTNLLHPTSGNVYLLPEGTLASLSTNGHKANVSMRFDMGDVNFDTWISIADLQLTVNHALDKSLGGLFNFTAADIIADKWVNVQDVVCLVNILMEPSTSRLSHRAPAFSDFVEAPADVCLFWRGNELVMQSQRDVAAIDLNLAGVTQVEWLPDSSDDYNHAMRSSDAGMHVIHYSMSGQTIAAGEMVLARVTGDQPRVSSVMMVDSKAQRISVAVEGTATGITDMDNRILVSADKHQVNISNNQELTYVSWSVYDLSGTMLGQGKADRWTAGTHSLPIGKMAGQQVVVRLKSDQQQLTKKININK